MRQIFATATLLALLASPAFADPKFNGWSGPKPKTPCMCRHADGKATLGETICRRIGGRMVTLRCELVLNNTSWRRIADGCGTAFLPRSEAREPLRSL